ncbi:ComEC/Rec2 family competence protein [Gordonia sinesedis]
MDLRLTVPAVAVWAVTLGALLGPSWTAPTLAGVAGATTVVLVVACVRRWVTWRVVGLAVVACGMTATCAAAMALRLDARDDHPVASIRGKTQMTVTVRDDPKTLGPAARGRVIVRVSVEAVRSRPVPRATADLVGRASEWAALVPGQRVNALVTVRPPRSGDLAVARLAAGGAPRLLGRPPPPQRTAAHIRARLQENAFRALPTDEAGLLPGLVLGDESGQSPQVRDDFRAAGLSHLTAVSGANFAIVVGAAILFIRLFGASPRVAAVAGFVVIVGFVILVRPSPSVIRAALMGSVGLLALLSSRRATAMPALGVAVIGGLLWWPELATAPGFALSVAATAGLVVLAPGIRDWLRDARVPPGIAEVLAIAIAAQIVTAPLIALINGRFSVVSVIANVVVAPVVGIISILGVVAAVLGALGPSGGLGTVAAELLIRALGPEVWWMVACARLFGGWRWATLDIPDGVPGAVLVLAATAAVAAVIAAWRARRADRRNRLARWAP